MERKSARAAGVLSFGSAGESFNINGASRCKKVKETGHGASPRPRVHKTPRGSRQTSWPSSFFLFSAYLVPSPRSGSGAPVLWQQRSVNVQATEARNVE